MECSLDISSYLEEISSLSQSIVFLYFFALMTEEGFLISPCYSLELCIQMGPSFLFSFAFHFSCPFISWHQGSLGFPGGSVGKGNCLQCVRPGFIPWVWKILWRREWQPTLVFLPGEFHGQRSLTGCSPWSCKMSDKTEQLTHTQGSLTPERSQVLLGELAYLFYVGI